MDGVNGLKTSFTLGFIRFPRDLEVTRCNNLRNKIEREMQRVKVRDKVMTWIMLFCSDCGYYPHFVDTIRIFLISTFRGYYPHFVDIYAFCGYYPHLVDIICISHITSYLACNVRFIFQIHSSSVRNWCITSITVCNLICFSVPSSFRIVCFVIKYKFNHNPIRICVSPFITSIKASFSFPLNFTICVLYWCVV